MKIIDYIKEDHLTPKLKGESKFQIIEELMDLMEKSGSIIDREIALQDVLAREGYLSTGLENGLAIPHAKTDGVKQLQIGFGVKEGGIDFESLDGKPASLIFLVLSPRDTSGPHIQALAFISRNLKEKHFRDALYNAGSAGEIYRIMKEEFSA
ncbi:MAG: PTS sugar transporter subunit IIA [Calditrichaceae bacterium]|nr:PTS sugar transporter subunit IIA [Calditrichaceae bacterium]MBN2709233.1 PTS sugar transporter subunit IIA [Calditrichaceae bacterium]RQV96186.1 MAG: PTS sugar transporter subunit IIA [Calditrichota bacterium]